MNTFAGAIALSALLLLPLCIAAIVWMLRQITGGGGHLRRVIGASVLLLCVAVAVLIKDAQTVSGIVLRKTEQIQVARTGLLPNIVHVLRVVVTPADAADDAEPSQRELTLAVDGPSFDHLADGQTVTLRQNRFGSLRFARLADVPAWKILPWPEVRRFWPWDDLQDSPRQDRVATSSAEVLEVRTVRQALLPSWTLQRDTTFFPLPQPYDEVTLRLHTPRGSEVVALDRIDAGSAAGLTVGHTVPVLIQDSRWREARIAVATRRYASRAWHARIGTLMPQFAAGITVALLLSLGLFALVRRAARRGGRRAPASRRAPAPRRGSAS